MIDMRAEGPGGCHVKSERRLKTGYSPRLRRRRHRRSNRSGNRWSSVRRSIVSFLHTRITVSCSFGMASCPAPSGFAADPTPEELPNRFGCCAQPLHDLTEIRSFNKSYQAPEFQVQYPDGLYLCIGEPNNMWVLTDCATPGERVIYAAAVPKYRAVLRETVGDIEVDDPKELKGSVGDTEFYVPDHRFEPVENAQEIRDSLHPGAKLEEALDTLWRTCKGCVGAAEGPATQK